MTLCRLSIFLAQRLIFGHYVFSLNPPMQTINRYVIHATSDGKPHTETWDCYSRFQAVQMFIAASLWTDTEVHTVDELGPVHELSPDWTLWG